MVAERLLLVEEMSELVDCIHSTGQCISLADPVLNIIINAVRRLLEQHCIDLPRRPQPRGWLDIAYEATPLSTVSLASWPKTSGT